jgi:hypothetical protein|nr:MAG TPA: hypothetical protein [Bacteriophage sp.]DAH96961.1 MAG TPA: hypothetical protein [Caudoviricetes sp.]DAL09134.1 MAG TPA_asm: hypothetical protein [Caudoviricetes sp.]
MIYPQEHLMKITFLFTSFMLPLHTIPILEEFKYKKLCR